MKRKLHLFTSKRGIELPEFNILNVLLYTLCFFLTAASALQAHSSSFFMPRSVTHSALYELAMTNYDVYHSSSCQGFSCYVTPFYIQSTNSSELGQYFLRNNDSSLDVQEDGTGNIGSLWVNLIADPGLSYSSTMKIAPQRKVAGSYFYFRADGRDLFDHTCPILQNLWMSVSFAAMKVRHNLHVSEHLTGDMAFGALPGVATGLEAFNNSEWKYGKLSTRTKSKSGVDDIQIKVGDNWFFDDGNSHFGIYLVGTIPTGDRPNAHVLFEPLVGTRHASFGIGINDDLRLYTCPAGTIQLMCDVKCRYLFSGRERRSFDLKGNGDWSRYLLLADSEATSVSLFGINKTTIPVKVTPGPQVEAWFALHANWCHWNVEMGYNLWWRSQDQRLHFEKELADNLGVFDLSGVVAFDPTSASRANISQSAIPPNQAPSDAVFTSTRGFDKASGKQKSAWSNTLYGAVSFDDLLYDRFPIMIGMGGSYEFASNRNALSQWSIWQTTGIDF